MKPKTTDLLARFVERRMRPTKVKHGEDGKTRFVWHVDDDDDRYVELVDSTHSDAVLVLMRDKNYAEATVLSDDMAEQFRNTLLWKTFVEQVRIYLNYLKPGFYPEAGDQ